MYYGTLGNGKHISVLVHYSTALSKYIESLEEEVLIRPIQTN